MNTIVGVWRDDEPYPLAMLPGRVECLEAEDHDGLQTWVTFADSMSEAVDLMNE